MSTTSDQRKREIRNQHRLQRQNEQYKAETVIDNSFNDPFKYNSVTRKSVAAKNATPVGSTSGNTGSGSGPVTILSTNVRLYILGQSGKTTLMKTNIANPNSLEIMTHSLNITANNSQYEQITMMLSDFNKNVLLTVPIDPIFGWTLLNQPSHDLNATLGSFSHDGVIYGLLTHDIDAISRWIAVCRFYTMQYEHAALGYSWVEIAQDIVPPLHTAPIIFEGDIVKVNYSLYAVKHKNICDYVQGLNSGTGQVSLLTKDSAPIMFTVGHGECPIPGVESAVVGMRKRNVKALVIPREQLEDGDSEDWPISIRKEHFLVCEIVILNHRQATEEVSNIKSLLLEDTPSSNNLIIPSMAAGSSTTTTATTTSEKKTKKNKKSKAPVESSDDDDDNVHPNGDDLFGDDSQSATTSSKKSRKTIKKAEKNPEKSSKSSHSGPFVDESNNDDDNSDGDDDEGRDGTRDEEAEQEEDQIQLTKQAKPAKSSSKSSKKAQQQQKQQTKRHISSAETVDGDRSDFEDDDEEEEQKVNKNNPNALPVFLPGMNQAGITTLPPAAVFQPAQNCTTQTDTTEKLSLSERMKKLATGNGTSVVAPTFNLPPVMVSSPILQSTPSPQLNQQPSATQYQPQKPQQQPQQQQSTYQTTQPQQQYQQYPQQQQQYQQYPQSSQYHQPQQQYHTYQPQQPQQPQQQQYSSPTILSPPATFNTVASNLQHTVPHILFELGLKQYTHILAGEALSTTQDLIDLTEHDWNVIQLPTGVKRKIRTYISNLSLSPTQQLSPNNSQSQPTTDSTTQDGSITDGAYQRGRQEATQVYMQKIKDIKATANDKFQEQNAEIAALREELAQTTQENVRNKEIVRQYVEKQRVQQQEQGIQMQTLKDQLLKANEKYQIDIDTAKTQFAADRIALLEGVYVQFSSQVNNNDVLDGAQINKTLKEVLKKVATSNQ